LLAIGGAEADNCSQFLFLIPELVSVWEAPMMKLRSLYADRAKYERPARCYRPRLECLETRDLPSTCTVDRLTDNNPGSGGEGGNGAGDLRWCVIESTFQADTIDFSVTGMINLSAGLPTLTRSVSIDGPGSDLMTVRRNTGGGYNIFLVGSGATVSISGLTITNGYVLGFGGGIYNAGTLTLSNSTVSGNLSAGTGNSYGGGIYSSGTLTVRDSTVSGNLVLAPYGSGSYGGGVYNGGTLTVSDSTVSDNEASNSGGLGNYGAGLYNSSAGTLTVSNSTISSNTNDGGYGGGILNDYGNLTVTDSTISNNFVLSAGYGGGIDNNKVMVVGNTIIAGNTATHGPDVNGNLGSQGYNLIGNPVDMTGWVDTDLLHFDPKLGPLQDNGGPTKTMALLPGSPALISGDPTQFGVPDQRGVVRSGGTNIGAYQASASAFSVGAPDTVTSGQPFDLVVTAVDPFGQVAVGYTGTVMFSTSDNDPNVQLPADYTFSIADAGVASFPGEATLFTEGVQTITATDIANNITGMATVTVLPSGALPGPHHDSNVGLL
jgi:hypothetical protein